MINKVWLALLSTLIFATSIKGEESGKLPRPESPKQDAIEALQKKMEVEKEDTPAGSQDFGYKSSDAPIPNEANQQKLIQTSYCHAYLMTPFSPLVYVDLSRIYLMNRQQKLGDNLYRYSLMELDFSSPNAGSDLSKGIPASKLFSLNGPLDLVILSHGAPPTGFTALSLVNDKDGCGRGLGAGVTIPVRSFGPHKLKPTRTLDDQFYSVVDSVGGRLIADYDKKLLKIMDPLSLQSRTAFNFQEGQIPLYWDAERKHIYAWNIKPLNQLVRMVGSTSNVIGRVKLKLGESLIRDFEKFGFARINVAKNSISIAEVKGWSGVERTASFTVTLPLENSVSHASVVPNFQQKLAIIYGGTPKSKVDWGSAFIYSYERQTLLAKLDVKSNEYIDSANFTPDGKSVLVVVADRANSLHLRLQIFDIKKRSWFEISAKDQ